MSVKIMSAEPARIPAADAGGFPQFMDLTDEELAVLTTRPDPDRLVVYPWLDQLSAPEQEIAMATAFRGLAARGLVAGAPPAPGDPARPEDLDDDGEVTLHPDLVQLQRLRLGRERLIVIERIFGARTDHLYAYDAGDATILVETIERTGLHHFLVTDPRGLVSVLCEYLAPARWPGGAGPDIVLSRQDLTAGRIPQDLLAVVEVSVIHADIVIRHAGQREDESLLAEVHSGPAAILAGRAPAGAGNRVFRHLGQGAVAGWVEMIISRNCLPIRPGLRSCAPTRYRRPEIRYRARARSGSAGTACCPTSGR
jgi:hypothetical protein